MGAVQATGGLALADRGADGFDDNGVCHGVPFPERSLTSQYRRIAIWL
jgi:hypothetical protein